MENAIKTVTAVLLSILAVCVSLAILVLFIQFFFWIFLGAILMVIGLLVYAFVSTKIEAIFNKKEDDKNV